MLEKSKFSKEKTGGMHPLSLEEVTCLFCYVQVYLTWYSNGYGVIMTFYPVKVTVSSRDGKALDLAINSLVTDHDAAHLITN